MGTMAGWVTRRKSKSEYEEHLFAKASAHGASEERKRIIEELSNLPAQSCVFCSEYEEHLKHGPSFRSDCRVCRMLEEEEP